MIDLEYLEKIAKFGVLNVGQNAGELVKLPHVSLTDLGYTGGHALKNILKDARAYKEISKATKAFSPDTKAEDNIHLINYIKNRFGGNPKAIEILTKHTDNIGVEFLKTLRDVEKSHIAKGKSGKLNYREFPLHKKDKFNDQLQSHTSDLYLGARKENFLRSIVANRPRPVSAADARAFMLNTGNSRSFMIKPRGNTVEAENLKKWADNLTHTFSSYKATDLRKYYGNNAVATDKLLAANVKNITQGNSINPDTVRRISYDIENRGDTKATIFTARNTGEQRIIRKLDSKNHPVISPDDYRFFVNDARFTEPAKKKALIFGGPTIKSYIMGDYGKERYELNRSLPEMKDMLDRSVRASTAKAKKNR